MRLQQLEVLAYNALDRVNQGAAVEDARVEFKREWPDKHDKAARQIAGHCNAAGGDWAIWVVGVDAEKGIIGAPLPDFEAWWPQVCKHFESDPPGLVGPVRLDVNGVSLAAIAFAPERAPYLVRNVNLNAAGGGGIEYEVPWRDGARTRTARRADLLRLLGRQVRTPRVDVIEAALGPELIGISLNGDGASHFLSSWRLWVKVAVVPEPGDVLRYLFRRSAVNIELNPSVALRGPWKIDVECDNRSQSDKISVDTEILEIRGAVTLNIAVCYDFIADIPKMASSPGTIELAPARDEPPIRLHVPACISEYYRR